MTEPISPSSGGALVPVLRTYSLEVIAISWERVHMTVRLRLTRLDGAPTKASTSNVAFVLVDGERVFDVASDDEGNGEFSIHVNVTTFEERKGIPNGTWRIHATIDTIPGPVASYDGSQLEYLDQASRVFLYNVNRSVMTVSYGVDENPDDPDRLDFLIRTYQLGRSPKPAKKPSLFKRVKNKYLGAKAKQKYAGWIYGTVARFIGPKKGRVLFASDQRLKIEGNLRRVQERMVERGLDQQFDMKYSFRLPGTTGWGTTIRILFLMATSEVVLLDDYFGLLKSVKIDPRSRVIQLWHAGSGFKSVGYSRFGNPGSPKLWHPHRQYTYAITGSEHLRHVYAEAFGIEESAILPTGLPRVDWFLDEGRTEAFVEQFYSEYPKLRNKRIILFAPTFRGRSFYSAFYDYSLIDFDALYKACGDDSVVLFRMHHFVKDAIRIPEQYRDRFFDFTKYPDGLGLLHVTDLLITDYSSIIYEYSLLDRPMLFFAPDRVNYAATRGFHRDYHETAPGRVCDTFDQVIEAITTGEFEQEKVARFRAENFDRIDTGAADRVIDWLILKDPRGDAPRPAAQTRQAAADDELSDEEVLRQEDADR